MNVWEGKKMESQAQFENEGCPQVEEMSEQEWREFEEWMENKYWQLQADAQEAREVQS